ncbi:IS5 family transposase [Streptomyces sp. NPDC000961]|uniref:IS5 family transposase n=1 Tax=Streptomyces sp. NPDC000961 TaxID=3364541 RepID=UPI003686A50A
MAKRNSRPWVVSDELCSLIEPLLPVPAPKLVTGWPRVPDRPALCGILFVLHTGIQWEYPPQELGFGSGMTCWRRLAAWNEAGVWDRLHVVLLKKLRSARQLEWSRAVIDSGHVRAARPGPKSGPSPVDRARLGGRHHLIVDRQGTPLAVSLTGGNRHDVTQLTPLLDAIPRIRGLAGRPRHRPGRLFADRGYDYDKYRRILRARGITPKIARRGLPHGSGLGKTRWVVERTFAWLHQFKRLRIRYEIRADLRLGLLQLACSIICLRRLRTSF